MTSANGVSPTPSTFVVGLARVPGAIAPKREFWRIPLRERQLVNGKVDGIGR